MTTLTPKYREKNISTHKHVSLRDVTFQPTLLNNQVSELVNRMWYMMLDSLSIAL